MTEKVADELRCIKCGKIKHMKEFAIGGLFGMNFCKECMDD